jgi:hypothetical protein
MREIGRMSPAASATKCWISVVAALTWATPSFAEETPQTGSTATSNEQSTSENDPRVERAREAFMLGAALARQGQWLDARAAFERSLRLRAHAVTLYNVGYCERALGRFTRARKSFLAALAYSADPQAGLPADLAAEAQGYLAEIERRSVRATVELADPAARLSIDGRPLELLGTSGGRPLLVAGTRDGGHAEVPRARRFDLLLDPGHHVFVLQSGGRESVLEREFMPGERPRVELVARGAAASSPPQKPPSPVRKRNDYTWPAVAYGVGAAGLVTGTIFGIATFKKANKLEDVCPEKQACPESSQADIDAGRRNGLISTVGFGVALVGAGVGTWLLLTDKPSHERAQRKPRASIHAGLGVGRFAIAGSF